MSLGQNCDKSGCINEQCHSGQVLRFAPSLTTEIRVTKRPRGRRNAETASLVSTTIGCDSSNHITNTFDHSFFSMSGYPIFCPSTGSLCQSRQPATIAITPAARFIWPGSITQSFRWGGTGSNSSPILDAISEPKWGRCLIAKK